ncbi:hypothetical protein [Rubrolithibacter danxiaensis]|uniref:hypothetical protein n=1 Tax=Rubrolithibacter danxiaensis TaxID=3390805 RepID=UPI003BF79766
MIIKSLKLYCILAVGCLYSCSEKIDLAHLKGTYKGTFIHTDMLSSFYPPPSEEAIVMFNSNTYTASPKGSGTFDILTENKIKFKDQNIWTANFDWNTILNGEYSYKLKGDSLFLQKENGSSIYEYRLKRTEQN